MSSLGNETLNSNSSLDDFLIREIMLTHDPDDRIELDVELLLSLVEGVVHSTLSDVSNVKSNVKIEGSIDMIRLEEPIRCTLYKISVEIFCRCFEHANMHKRTIVLLEMMSQFRWDAKVVLVLAAFMPSFGIFWLIKRLQTDDLLALSVALLKQLPSDITTFDPRSKALMSLIKCLVKVTKVIIMAESTPLSHDNNAMAITKSKIYIATYWIIRSILECSSQIADLRSLRNEQLFCRYSDAQIVAAWMLYSLSNKLNRLCVDLEEQIEKSLQEKLVNVFKQKQIDNQEALKTLFSCKIEIPSNHHASKKVDIFELKNKVVMLLISRPDLPIDKVLFLVQQTYDHPQHKQIEENYAILWVPITSSNEWSDDDKINFGFFSRSLPWLSVRQPWTMSSSVVNFIEQEWNFKEESLMVVLDVDGMVTNLNAMDMVLIWGPKAFPFSTLRKQELLEKEKWSLELIINGISPLLNNEVEGGKNICIYGSENIDWIRDFTAKMKKLKDGSIQLQLVHVGCRNPTEKHLQNIIDIINQENLGTSLASSNIHFFWFRLETIRTSIAHQENTQNRDNHAKELAEFLDFGGNKEGWAVFGKDFSTDVIKLSGESIADLGFAGAIVGAIGDALKASSDGESCDHTELVPYEEGLDERSVVCGVCKRNMKTFVLYQCDVVAE